MSAAVAEETLGARLAAIRFNGDGSATGGRIELTDGEDAEVLVFDLRNNEVSELWS